MKELYYKDTDVSHKEYSLGEIKSIILEQFNESDYVFVEKFFRQLNHEEDIQTIIRKNNELTQIMISASNNEEEKKKKKKKLYQKLMLYYQQKKKLISLLIQITKEDYEE